MAVQQVLGIILCVQDLMDWNNKIKSIYQTNQERGIALRKLLSLPAEDRELLAQFDDEAICIALLPGAGMNHVGTITVHTSQLLQIMLILIVGNLGSQNHGT